MSLMSNELFIERECHGIKIKAIVRELSRLLNWTYGMENAELRTCTYACSLRITFCIHFVGTAFLHCMKPSWWNSKSLWGNSNEWKFVRIQFWFRKSGRKKYSNYEIKTNIDYYVFILSLVIVTACFSNKNINSVWLDW